MKTITCRALGGPCDAPITAESYDEMIKKGMEHLEKVHPKMAADVKKAPKDDPMMIEWDKSSRKMWAEAPEM